MDPDLRRDDDLMPALRRCIHWIRKSMALVVRRTAPVSRAALGWGALGDLPRKLLSVWRHRRRRLFLHLSLRERSMAEGRRVRGLGN